MSETKKTQRMQYKDAIKGIAFVRIHRILSRNDRMRFT
jgi:hypothetical protein